MKFILAGLLGLFLPIVASAHPRDRTSVIRTQRNDGDSVLPFAITVSSGYWTIVGSSNTFVGSETGPSRLRRRSLSVQTLSAVAFGICLSTSNSNTVACDDNSGGHELGSAWSSVTIFDEAAWYARTRAGGPGTIKGAEHYDSRDEKVAK